MVNTNRTSVDCACVIHGTGYSWQYVENLHNMLSRNLSRDVVLHVYTEASRTVPAPFVKHELTDWPGIGGRKRSWWYKMQLFNANEFRGNLLYFDLDIVLVRNIDWILQHHMDYFWTIQDFRYLQSPAYKAMNSSVMYWNTERFAWVWDQFASQDINTVVRGYPGDQDYLNRVLTHNHKRYLNLTQFQSWRWQVADGGYNFKHRCALQPGTGATISPDASVIVFHGNPKPHEVTDPQIQALWR